MKRLLSGQATAKLVVEEFSFTMILGSGYTLPS